MKLTLISCLCVFVSCGYYLDKNNCKIDAARKCTSEYGNLTMRYGYVSLGEMTEKKCIQSADQIEDNPALPFIGAKCYVNDTTTNATETVNDSGQTVFLCEEANIEVNPSLNTIYFPGGEDTCSYLESWDWEW